MSKLATDIASEAWRYFPDTYASYASLGKWKRYKHLAFIAFKIAQAIARGRGRILVSLPPRHGKSLLISKWTPLWFLENSPEKNIILCSYEAGFAAYWGRAVRNEATENERISVSLAEDSQAAAKWNTKEGGGMVTAGVGGPITGRGADVLIIDDACKNWQDAMSETKREATINWFNSTAYSRLEPSATVIILMQRWHQRDLLGYLKDEHEEKWEDICLPALAEENDPLGRAPGDALCSERFTGEDLQKIKTAIGTRMFSAQYQQRPSPQEGNVWMRQNWRYHNNFDPEAYDEIIQSWDMRFKEGDTGDYVAGQVWGRKGAACYLLHRVKGRWGFKKTIDVFKEVTIAWPKARAKLVENKANGPAIEDQLKSQIAGIRLVEPQGGKLARAMACEPYIEAGNIYLPDPKFHPWIEEFIEEAAAFPNATHDDEVDAASQSINYLMGKGNRLLKMLSM